MAKTTKSGLAGKLGAAGAKAVEAHKREEISYGQGGDLPAGIDNGIARLVECKFDEYKTGSNAGEWYFYAAGVVVAPTECGGIPIEGLRTSIMEPLCETPTRKRATVDDHMAWVLNEMKKLGADVSEASLDDLESIAASLKEAAPYFRFRTWKGQPQTTGPYAGQEPRTNHDWNGSKGLEDYSPDGDDGVDEEPEEPEEPVSKVKTKIEPKKGEIKTNAKKAPPEPEPEEVLEPEVSEPEEIPFGDDLDDIATEADGGDKKQQVELANLAKKAGIDKDDVESAENWAAVAEMIRKVNKAAKDEDGSSTEEIIPEIGQIFLYKVSGAKRPTDFEVVKVFEKNKTVHVKDAATGKLLLGLDKKPLNVKWSDLES